MLSSDLNRLHFQPTRPISTRQCVAPPLKVSGENSASLENGEHAAPSVAGRPTIENRCRGCGAENCGTAQGKIIPVIHGHLFRCIRHSCVGMTLTMTGAVEMADEELVAQSLRGNRDAFGRIVSRYQSLIRSLATSPLQFHGDWRRNPMVRSSKCPLRY